MKRKIIYLAVFIIIFIAGAMTGIIFAGYHTSKALKLLTYNEVVKGYDDVQLAYRTNNPELIIWELEHFNLLLDKIESYKVISDAAFMHCLIVIQIPQKTKKMYYIRKLCLTPLNYIQKQEINRLAGEKLILLSIVSLRIGKIKLLRMRNNFYIN